MKKSSKGSLNTLFIAILFLVSFVSNAQTKHKVGEQWGGGIVFVIVADGLHGLIAETIDQGTDSWEQAVQFVKDSSKHSEEGSAFNDWRLPDKGELSLLFHQRNIVGGFINDNYWSSTEFALEHAFFQDFNTGYQGFNYKYTSYRIRAIRAF